MVVREKLCPQRCSHARLFALFLPLLTTWLLGLPETPEPTMILVHFSFRYHLRVSTLGLALCYRVFVCSLSICVALGHVEIRAAVTACF